MCVSSVDVVRGSLFTGDSPITVRSGFTLNLRQGRATTVAASTFVERGRA